MIENGFTYLAALIFIAAIIVYLPKVLQGPIATKFFNFIPPTVVIYLGLMILGTIKLWSLEATSATYSAVKNPLLYAMLFVMLLRCDLRKICMLGPKMLIAFFSATLSIMLGFIIIYAIFSGYLGADAWRAFGSLAGSWIGGTGNMVAVQEALHVSENSMVFVLAMDSICTTPYIAFLLWAVTRDKVFNKWTKADTSTLDAVGAALAEADKKNTNILVWQNVIMMVGAGFMASAVSQKAGVYLAEWMPMFDKNTWTVLFVTLLGVICALTPLGKMKGIEEVSNTMLYIIVALIASRADLSDIGKAPIWLVCGFLILAIHVLVMLILAKILRLDIFTCSVASLANIGAVATAPVLAGTYSGALVPVGIVMALLGYIVGTGGALAVANIMSFFA